MVQAQRTNTNHTLTERARSVKHLSGSFQKCSKNHQISVLSLPVLVRSPSRVDPEADFELSKNILWATPKQERALDAVTLCENVLELLQVSIQKTHHKQKLEKIIQLPKYLVRLVKKCQEVVFLSVTPMRDTASSVMVWFVHLAHCDGVVRVGLLCLNHPELEHKHPPHLSLAVMVWFV